VQGQQRRVHVHHRQRDHADAEEIPVDPLLARLIHHLITA
jgi:hypothetical protein